MQHNQSIEQSAKLHAAQVRARLFNSKPVMRLAPPKLIVVERAPRPIRDERDHVDRWLAWMSKPLRMYIMTRSTELGSSYDQVIGTSRKSFIVSVRHQIMWEIKNHVKPNISYPEIGRIFERYHTTILSGIRRHSKIRESIAQKQECVSNRHLEILLMLEQAGKFGEKTTELRDRVSLKKRGFIEFDFNLMRNVLTDQGKSYLSMARRVTETADAE